MICWWSQAVHLDPAGVALGDGVLVVVPDTPGRAHGPVDHAHDDGQPRARGPVDLLVHVEQAVGAGGGEGPRAGRAGGDAGRQGGVLALDGDVLGLHLAGLDELGELLGERSLRRDGIGGDHLGAGQLDPQGGGDVAVLDYVHGRGPSVRAGLRLLVALCRSASSTMVMALVGHSSAQMAQPLQYS